MYKVKVNNNKEYELELDKGRLSSGGEAIEWDIAEINKGEFHIIKDGQSYTAQVIDANAEEKKFTIRVNGNDYSIEVKDKYDLLLQQLGLNDRFASKVNDIKAPMPGLVLNVNVTEGQEVKKGDVVLILEAMKMENVLKSPGEGKVKSIKVKKGDAVEKGQVLVVME